MSLSLQSFYMPKKEVWGYAKKKRDTWSSQNSKRKEKNGTHEGSKVLKKRREKYSPYFQGNYQIERKSWWKGVPKILGLGKYSTHLHILIKVYDLHLLGSGFWLNIICDVSMLLIHTYLKLHSKPFRDRMKRRQNNQMPWWGSYTLSDRVNHLRNLHFILQNS